METFYINTSFRCLIRHLMLQFFFFIFESRVNSYNMNTHVSIIKLRKMLPKRSIIFLIISLLYRRINRGHFPVSNIYESLLFLAFLFIYFLISLQSSQSVLERNNIKYIALFQKLIDSILSVIPVALLGFASFFLPPELQKSTPLIPALKSNWLFMHASVILVAYAGLLIGSLISIIFLRINKWDLLGKPWFISFLEKLDEISYRFILFSYPFLSLGILSGAVWANETWGSYWNWDPKETWSLITWLIFAAYLHERLLKKKKGRKAASIARGGFRRIWITFLGVNLLGKGLHSYGWF